MLHTLASSVLALLSSSEEEEAELSSHAAEQPELIAEVVAAFDADGNGELSATQARRCFETLARELLVTAAAGSAGRDGQPPRRRAAAAAHAKRLLNDEAALDGGGDGGSPSSSDVSAVSEMAGHLLALAGGNGDGRVSLTDLALLFSDSLAAGGARPAGSRPPGVGTLPPLFGPHSEPLNELRDCLRLPPRVARHFESHSDVGDGRLEDGGRADGERGREGGWGGGVPDGWHERVPGDSHTLMRWRSPGYSRDQLSIVGLGRSADASCYYLPEWGIVLDAGLAAKSFAPRMVLLTHGHRWVGGPVGWGGGPTHARARLAVENARNAPPPTQTVLPLSPPPMCRHTFTVCHPPLHVDPRHPALARPPPLLQGPHAGTARLGAPPAPHSKGAHQQRCSHQPAARVFTARVFTARLFTARVFTTRVFTARVFTASCG